MKKTLIIILAIVMAMSVFTACAPKADTEAPAHIESTTEPAPATEQPATQPEQPAANADGGAPAPADASPTTGLAGHPAYKPVIVQIENEPPARPQAGLQQADIVYETMIEGIDTRFTCIFNDTYPDEVGPVRSSRYYHQRIQQEWDALYVHQGGPEDPNFKTTYIYGESGDHIKQRINGVRGKNANLIYRRQNTGKALEHTAYTNVKKDAEVYEYEPQQKQALKFYPTKNYTDQPAIKDIQLSFWSKPGFVEYKYDAASNKLIRYMGGKEFIAEETGKPVEVQNLVVQYVSVSEAANEGGRKLIEVSGEGPALFIINGKYMEGTWSRPSYADKTTYKLASGEEVTFTPGNTWIEMHPNNKSVIANMEDGTQKKHNA